MFEKVETQIKIQFFVSCLCVFVITVGGQKYFGYFFHATKEERKLRLVEKEKNKQILDLLTEYDHTYKCRRHKHFTYIFHNVFLQIFNSFFF